MNIAFRVDASSEMGTGHLMRCCTLADALRAQGAVTRFVCRQIPEGLAAMLQEKGHQLAQLVGGDDGENRDGLAHSQWLGVSQGRDARDTAKALEDAAWGWIIVDHYALDARWESALRPAARRIMAIDDIADRRHDCDVLLDQNLYADMDARYAGKVPAHCQLLLGPRYALLREEFGLLRKQVAPRTGPVKRVLVFFGGMDAGNYTAAAVAALANACAGDVHVDVVIGAHHAERERIASACAARGFSCHVQTSRMAELMAGADLAIGAGGSTTWERCCLGLPSLSMSVAENQRRQVADAGARGLLYALDEGDGLVDLIGRHARALMENGVLRQAISRNGMEAVDGLGASRVIRCLSSGDIAVREANDDDAPKIFEWRNHPEIRNVSRDAEAISWETHKRWFAAVMSDPDRILLIGQRGDAPVGIVRYDIRGDAAEVSIYLVPGTKASGSGGGLLASAERWLKEHRPDVCSIHAEVLADNEPSHRMFSNGGYERASALYTKRLREI